MEDNLLFKEDARKYKKIMIAVAVLMYTCFAVFTAVLLFEVITKKYEFGLLKCIGFIVPSLVLAVYSTWAVCSKYLKYYMFISEDKIVFFESNREHIYQVSDFTRFEKIKSKSNYTVYRLFFGDNAHAVTSFHTTEFENVLNSIKLKSN